MPDRRPPETLFNNLIKYLLLAYTMHPCTVGNIVIDRFRDWVRFLEYHADFRPHFLNCKRFIESDLLAVDDVTFRTYNRYKLHHAVHSFDESRFATDGWTDDGGNFIFIERKVYILECMLVSVPEIDFFCFVNRPGTMYNAC